MKRKSPIFTESVICQCCGKESVKTSAMQKYCKECSRNKELERKAKWMRKNPLNPERTKLNKQKTKSRNIERGLINNKTTVENLFVYPEVNLWWQIKIAVPFSYSVSKNHLWSSNSSGHIYRREESNKIQEDIILMLKSAMGNQKIYRNKVWIDIYVQKPDHKGDAINVVDLVADAVKVAIGIDDRWFSIRRLDWQIVKENPRLYIGVGQQDDFDAKICSYCGRILPEEMFGKAKRECKECTSARVYNTAHG